MKNIMLPALALAAVAASPAMAQTSTVNITAEATESCSGATFATITLGDIRAAGGGGLNTAAVNGGSTSNAAAVYCNGVNSTLVLSAPALVRATSVSLTGSPFTNVVNYVATASLASGGYASGVVNQSATTNGTKLDPAAASSAAGGTLGLLAAAPSQLVITLSGAAMSDSASYLVAGNYTSTITLTFGAVP